MLCRLKLFAGRSVKNTLRKLAQTETDWNLQKANYIYYAVCSDNRTECVLQLADFIIQHIPNGGMQGMFVIQLFSIHNRPVIAKKSRFRGETDLPATGSTICYLLSVHVAF